MSDLISRNKVINILEKEKSLSCGYDSDITIFSIEKGIRELPTAYSVDGVIEELEELKIRYFLTIANTGDKKADFAYENVGNALDKSIEIVKQGGVSDDVCEWKYINDFELTSDNHESKCIERCNYIYCPYCGKKIKIVGD